MQQSGSFPGCETVMEIFLVPLGLIFKDSRTSQFPVLPAGAVVADLLKLCHRQSYRLQDTSEIFVLILLCKYGSAVAFSSLS